MSKLDKTNRRRKRPREDIGIKNLTCLHTQESYKNTKWEDIIYMKRTWCCPTANLVHVGSMSEFINFAFIDLGGLAFPAPSIPSCSYTLSPSSSVGFMRSEGRDLLETPILRLFEA